MIPELDPEVRDHEPRQALDGGEDGLILQKNCPEAPEYLKPARLALLEIGYDQGKACEAFAGGGFSSVEIIKDLAGLDRVAAGCLGAGARSEGVRKCLISWRIFLIRLEEILRQLNEPGVAEDAGPFQRLMKEQAELQPIADTYLAYKKNKETISDSLELLEGENDEEMRGDAEGGIGGSQKKRGRAGTPAEDPAASQGPQRQQECDCGDRAGAGGRRGGPVRGGGSTGCM